MNIHILNQDGYKKSMAPAYSANQCVQLFILSLAVLCSLVSSKVQLEKNMYVKTFIHKLRQDPYSSLADTVPPCLRVLNLNCFKNDNPLSSFLSTNFRENVGENRYFRENLPTFHVIKLFACCC
jgi:hypothetical protein